jgi:hypothetical protein
MWRLGRNAHARSCGPAGRRAAISACASTRRSLQRRPGCWWSPRPRCCIPACRSRTALCCTSCWPATLTGRRGSWCSWPDLTVELRAWPADTWKGRGRPAGGRGRGGGLMAGRRAAGPAVWRAERRGGAGVGAAGDDLGARPPGRPTAPPTRPCRPAPAASLRGKPGRRPVAVAADPRGPPQCPLGCGRVRGGDPGLDGRSVGVRRGRHDRPTGQATTATMTGQGDHHHCDPARRPRTLRPDGRPVGGQDASDHHGCGPAQAAAGSAADTDRPASSPQIRNPDGHCPRDGHRGCGRCCL